MKLWHPEHFVMLLGFFFMLSTATLHILGFILDKPQLLSWGRWTCVAMVIVAFTPFVVFVVGSLFEKKRDGNDSD